MFWSDLPQSSSVILPWSCLFIMSWSLFISSPPVHSDLSQLLSPGFVQLLRPLSCIINCVLILLSCRVLILFSYRFWYLVHLCLYLVQLSFSGCRVQILLNPVQLSGPNHFNYPVFILQHIYHVLILCSFHFLFLVIYRLTILLSWCFDFVRLSSLDLILLHSWSCSVKEFSFYSVTVS